MSRSDIHDLLMLKLAGGLSNSQLVEIDHLISSKSEVLDAWQKLQDYYCVYSRRDFECISVYEIIKGVRDRSTFVDKITFADIIAFCRRRAVAIASALSFRPDLKPFFTFVNTTILNVLWIRKGYLSLEERRSLITSIADNPILMMTISPRAFEEIIAELFRNDGFQVVYTGKPADGGIDVIVSGETKAGLQKYAIQCKRYTVKKVGIEAVRSLYGVKVHGNFTQAVIVTTSTFTTPAIRFSKDRLYELTLKNGSDVRDWCKAYRDKKTG